MFTERTLLQTLESGMDDPVEFDWDSLLSVYTQETEASSVPSVSESTHSQVIEIEQPSDVQETVGKRPAPGRPRKNRDVSTAALINMIKSEITADLADGAATKTPVSDRNRNDVLRTKLIRLVKKIP